MQIKFNRAAFLFCSLALAGFACGGSEKDDPEDDAGIVVVTDGGHGESDAGPVISDGGSKCTQADQYCNTDDRNGMRCKNGDWVVWTCNAGTSCFRADNGYLSCVPDECPTGSFGESCQKCTCKHGVCNDGKKGDGKCQECSGKYWGENCDKEPTCVHGTPSIGIDGTGKCLSCDEDYWDIDKDCAETIDGYMADKADRIYPTVDINGQIWMAQNMTYKTTDYIPHNKNSETYGYFYTWEDAKKNVCPAGWHLPTKDDFDALLEFVGEDPKSRAAALKSTEWVSQYQTATNSSGFTALPAGHYHRQATGSSYREFGLGAGFWSDTACETDNGTNGIYYLDIYNYNARMYCEDLKDYGQSVRCIQDAK